MQSLEPADVRIEFLRPPLPAALAAQVAALVYPVLHEEFLERLLLGQFGPGAEFLSGVAMEGDRLAGHAWIGWGRDAAPIGVVAGVVTDERCRGRGIASALVGELCRRFDAAGGTLLFLGTTNPAARRIYERLGFRDLIGSVYCRGALASAVNFAPGLATRAHAASWRDMGRILPLYLLPHPCMVMDAGIELPSTRLLPPWRCFRIFWESWQSVEDGGAWELLENARGWAVASALARPMREVQEHPRTSETVILSEAKNLFADGRPATCRPFAKPALNEVNVLRVTDKLPRCSPSEPSGYGQAGFSMDFVWHSDYPDVGLEFVRDFLLRTEQRYRAGAALFLCERDEWKRRAAQALGFSCARRAARHMLVSGERWALDEFRRDY